MVKSKIVNNRILIVVVACILAFVLGVFNFGVNAKATSVTTPESLNTMLTNLKNNKVARETVITIDGAEDIDFIDYPYVPFSLTNTNYDGKDLSIVFNVGVKNVIHKTTEANLSTNEHYGLFINALSGYIPISYKVNFEVGDGTIEGAFTHYLYGGKAKALPNVIAPEGSTFVKWILKGDVTESAVTSILPSDWGVKSYVAVYENETQEPEPDPEPDPEPEPEPKTYQIVYTDTYLNVGVDGLENAYTEGMSLSLGLLEREGFVFNGWSVGDGSDIVDELPAELPSSYISADDKIYLNAVWELENPSIVSFNGISKRYDGNSNILGVSIAHSILNELSVSYSWESAESEQDKTNPVSCGSSSTLSFLTPISKFYRVGVKVSHLDSGLESESLFSDWVKVEITKANITVSLIENVLVTKIYDGNASADGLINKGVHYNVLGVIDGDEVDVNLSSAEFDSKHAGMRSVKVTFSSLSFNSAVEELYDFSPVSLTLGGEITAKEIYFNKLRSPDISKDYDGTNACEYQFAEGVDYAINGLVDDLSYLVSASYDNKNAGDRSVELILTFQSDDYYMVENQITYTAKINRKNVIPVKLEEELTIIKPYDGNRTVSYVFNYGTEYGLDGIVENEIEGVEVFASYDKNGVDATAVTVVFGELIFNTGVIKENYSYQSNAYEIYFDASITPLKISASPSEHVKVYGEEEDLKETIITGINDETILVRYLRESGEIVGEYSFVGVEMLSDNSNYIIEYVANAHKFIITPRVPDLIFPSFESVSYNPIRTLNDMQLAVEGYDFVDGKYLHSLGEFYWLNSEYVPSVDNSGYIMVFVPNDKHNYDYTSLEGYTQNGEIVIRNLPLTVTPIDPVPTEIAEEFTLAVGMLWENVTLPNGWSLVASEELDPGSVIIGDIDNTYTYANALRYTHDESKNYNTIYKDLVVNYTSSSIIYTYNGENISSVNLATVNRGLNEEIIVSFVLENPFEEVGYKTIKWSFGGIDLIPEENDDIYLGATYIIEDANVIKNEIVVEVAIAPRDDIKITYLHFYENSEGAFNLESDEEIVLYDGVADALRSVNESDVINKVGFNYVGAKFVGGEEYVSEFTVLADGSSVVNMYYSRKNVNVAYVDDRYTGNEGEGTLPEGKTVKYGVPFLLDAPINYIVYGYSFIGYTDGITFEGESLKIFNDSYVVEQDVASVKFSLCLKANDNVGYLVKKYFDNELHSEMRFGSTGELVDITNETYSGYERVANVNEVLSGVISGYIKDENDIITGGTMLELVIYYATKRYQFDFDDSLGLEDFEAKEGETIVLPPVPSVIPEGKTFVGWEIDGVLYMAGDNFVMPAGSVNLVPKWMAIEETPNPDDNPVPDLPSNDDEVENGDNSSNDGEENNDEKLEEDGIGVGATIGIVLGALAGVAVVLGISITIGKKNKDREMIIGRMEAKRRSKK